MFSGGNGVIFGRDTDGDLWWYKDLAQDGTSRWDPGSGAAVGWGIRPCVILLPVSRRGQCRRRRRDLRHRQQRRTPLLQSAEARRLNPDTQQVKASVRRTIRTVLWSQRRGIKGDPRSISPASYTPFEGIPTFLGSDLRPVVELLGMGKTGNDPSSEVVDLLERLRAGPSRGACGAIPAASRPPASHGRVPHRRRGSRGGSTPPTCYKTASSTWRRGSTAISMIPGCRFSSGCDMVVNDRLATVHRHYLGTRMRDAAQEVSLHRDRCPRRTARWPWLRCSLGVCVSPSISAIRAEQILQVQGCSQLARSARPRGGDTATLRAAQQGRDGGGARPYRAGRH